MTGSKARTRVLSGAVRLVSVVGATWAMAGAPLFADQQEDANAAAMQAALRRGGADLWLCFYPTTGGRHVLCETVGVISRVFPSAAPAIGQLVSARAEQWARRQLAGGDPLSALRSQFLGCVGPAGNRAGLVVGTSNLTWSVGGDPTGQTGSCASPSTPSVLDGSLGAWWLTADTAATYMDALVGERQGCMRGRVEGQRAARQQAGSLMGDPGPGNPGTGGSQPNTQGSTGGRQDPTQPGDRTPHVPPFTPDTPNPNLLQNTPGSSAGARFVSDGEAWSRRVRIMAGRYWRNLHERLGMQATHGDNGDGSNAVGIRGYCIEGMDCAAASSCAGQAHGRAMAKALEQRLAHSCNANVMPTPEGPSACVTALGGGTLSEAQLTQLKREVCQLVQGMMGGGGDLVYMGCETRTAPNIAAARRVGCADPAAMCTPEQNVGAGLPPGFGVPAGPGGPRVGQTPGPTPNPDPNSPPGADPQHPPF